MPDTERTSLSKSRLDMPATRLFQKQRNQQLFGSNSSNDAHCTTSTSTTTTHQIRNDTNRVIGGICSAAVGVHLGLCETKKGSPPSPGIVLDTAFGSQRMNGKCIFKVDNARLVEVDW
jgi:hypothetical protein